MPNRNRNVFGPYNSFTEQANAQFIDTYLKNQPPNVDAPMPSTSKQATIGEIYGKGAQMYKFSDQDIDLGENSTFSADPDPVNIPPTYLGKGPSKTEGALSKVSDSGAAIGGLAFMGGTIASGAFNLIGQAVGGAVTKSVMDKQYGLAKQAASDSGMPLANVLGFGASLPHATSYNGGATTTTSGQGMQNPHYKGTPSQVSNGYGMLW